MSSPLPDHAPDSSSETVPSAVRSVHEVLDYLSSVKSLSDAASPLLVTVNSAYQVTGEL